jgi:hypothetical protein
VEHHDDASQGLGALHLFSGMLSPPVVALAAIRIRMASRCGAILGASAMIATSIWAAARAPATFVAWAGGPANFSI